MDGGMEGVILMLMTHTTNGTRLLIPAHDGKGKVA